MINKNNMTIKEKIDTINSKLEKLYNKGSNNEKLVDERTKLINSCLHEETKIKVVSALVGIEKKIIVCTICNKIVKDIHE
jgi:hypothetical protein